MNTLKLILLMAIFALPALADIPIRADLDRDVPLAEALAEANKHYPPELPLTEDEVIAAIENLKLNDPTIPQKIFQIYERIAKERILPRGMYFSHMGKFSQGPNTVGYIVDWRDLTLNGQYNYRIRSRYIGRDPLIFCEVPPKK